uniref:Uncharacterized protein n=1 Tax=viral metagenome TaxID=1070528 RepID=A0A6C0KTA9_9ZZZZ
MGQSSSEPEPEHLTWKIISDKQIGNAILQTAEDKDHYLKECHLHKSNSLARRSQSYSANSMNEKEYYQRILEKAMELIPRRLKMELREIAIISLMPSADGGMPHTRPSSIICFPNPKQMLSTSTLIHELWHIHQRLYIEKWAKTFETMGWSKWNGALPKALDTHRRFNPDTIDCPLWIFHNRWVPVPIFKDVMRPEMGEVFMWFYDAQDMVRVTSIPLELQTEYPNMPASAYEHPREITAYLLADHDKYLASPGFLHLLDAIGHLSIIP